MSSSPASRPRWTHVALVAAKVALSVGLMAYLITRFPVASLGASLRHARPDRLAAAWTLMLASNLLGAFQWARLLAAVEITIPFWKVCAYYHVGLFFNNFLPANIGGDAARVMDAARYGRTRAAALSTVVMDRIIGTVALAGLALVTTLPVIDRFHLGLVYLAVVGFFVLSVSLLWVVFHPRLLPVAERLLGAVGLKSLSPHLDELALRFQSFRDRRPLIGALLLLAVLVQVSRVLVHVLVARALGIALPVAYFFLFVPLLAVIVSVPISFNGIGVREGAGIVLFGLVGVDRVHAFSLQLTTFVVAVSVSLLGGLIWVARAPRRSSEARALRRTT